MSSDSQSDVSAAGTTTYSETTFTTSRDTLKVPTGLEATLYVAHQPQNNMIKGLFSVTEQKDLSFERECQDLGDWQKLFKEIAYEIYCHRPMVPLAYIEGLLGYHDSGVPGFEWELRARGNPPDEEWVIHIPI
jgi:hypothetical protein